MKATAALAAGVLLAVLTPCVAAAQDAPAPAAPACHVDTLGVDTTVDSLYVWIPPIDAYQSQAEHAFQMAQARAVLTVLRTIPTLGVPDRAQRFDRDTRLGRTPLETALALVWFQVRDDGRLAGMSVINWSGWDSLDLALQRAILRADSLKLLHAPPAELAGQGVDLWLAVGLWQGNAVDDVPVGRILRLRPRVRGVVQAPRLISWGYRPQFPSGAARVGLGDKLLLEFYVDTAGRVEPDSIVFLQATYREFAEEALKLVRSGRYMPAHVGPCPIRQRIQQAVFFQVGGPP